MSDTKASPISQSAATDVPELIQELDGGNFERMLSIALSQSAAAAVDNSKVAEVTVKFKLKPIGGTHQVHCEHELVFKKPTANGKTSEQATQTTTLHVGKFGRLSLIPESQSVLFDKAGKATA
ncbi:MAG: hypothetical protein ACK5VJ_00465 [Pseudomonadota bacterium]|jgi:hypothetical protein